MPSLPAKPSSPHQLATGKYAALIALLGVSLGGLWHSSQTDLALTIDRGQANQAHRIWLWTANERGIEHWLRRQVMTRGSYEHRSDPGPVRFAALRVAKARKTQAEQQPGPQALDDLLIEADEQGFGYIAMALVGPESTPTRRLLKAAAPALQIPQGARWAVLQTDTRVNHLAVTFGQAQPGIAFTQHAAARASLMQALFAQTELARFHNLPDTGIKPAATKLDKLPIQRVGLNLETLAWQPFAFAELTHLTLQQWPAHLKADEPTMMRDQPLTIAGPLQIARAQPLTPHALWVAKTPLEWSSRNGQRAKLRARPESQGWELTVLFRDGATLTPSHCSGLPDEPVLAFRLNAQGDAVELRRRDHAHEVYALSVDDTSTCHAQRRSRVLAGQDSLVLGSPDRFGRSSWLAAGQDRRTLAWRTGTQTGRWSLPDREFVRDGWHWQDDDVLLAITKSSDAEQSPFQLEEIREDPQGEQGLARTVVQSFETLEPARAALPQRPVWHELADRTQLWFGSQMTQAMLVPPSS